MNPYPNIRKGLTAGTIAGVIVLALSLSAPDSNEGVSPPMWRLWVGHVIIFAIPFFVVGLLAAFRPERTKK